jgi:hypothetical protein
MQSRRRIEPIENPQWIVNLGDVSFLDYGGFMVREDGDIWLIEEPEDANARDHANGGSADNDTYTVYRFSADYPRWLAYASAFVRHGTLDATIARQTIDGQPAVKCREWWLEADKLEDICSATGITAMQFLRLALSRDIVERAAAYQLVAQVFGAIELDSYPETFTRAQLEKVFSTWNG